MWQTRIDGQPTSHFPSTVPVIVWTFSGQLLLWVKVTFQQAMHGTRYVNWRLAKRCFQSLYNSFDVHTWLSFPSQKTIAMRLRFSFLIILRVAWQKATFTLCVISMPTYWILSIAVNNKMSTNLPLTIRIWNSLSTKKEADSASLLSPVLVSSTLWKQYLNPWLFATVSNFVLSVHTSLSCKHFMSNRRCLQIILGKNVWTPAFRFIWKVTDSLGSPSTLETICTLHFAKDWVAPGHFWERATTCVPGMS